MIALLFIGPCFLWRNLYLLATNEYAKDELPRALKSFSLPALYSGFYLLQLKHVLYKPLSRKFLALLWALTLLHSLVCITYACAYFSPVFNNETIYNTLHTIASFIRINNYYDDTPQKLTGRLITVFTMLVFLLQGFFHLANWKILYRLKLGPKKNRKSRKWAK